MISNIIKNHFAPNLIWKVWYCTDGNKNELQLCPSMKQTWIWYICCYVLWRVLFWCFSVSFSQNINFDLQTDYFLFIFLFFQEARFCVLDILVIFNNLIWEFPPPTTRREILNQTYLVLGLILLCVLKSTKKSEFWVLTFEYFAVYKKLNSAVCIVRSLATV